MRSLFMVVLLSLCLGLAWGSERYPFQDASQAKQFDTLTHRFRCMVCQNEDLAASQATLAEQLKDQIYHMTQSGMSSDQIQAYMIKRYGDFIMLKPPFVMRTWMLWLMPIVFLLIGGFILWRLSKNPKEQSDA